MLLLRHAGIVGFWTLISRILGLWREVLFAAALATSNAADAFLTAFRLPNTLRTIFAEGALHVTFLPAYKKEQVQSDQQAQIFAGQVLTLLLSSVLLITTLAIIFMPSVMGVFAYGFTEEPEKFSHTVALARIVFPYIVLMALVALMTAIDNAHQHFVAGSAAPTILNLILIGILLGFTFEVVESDLTLLLAGGVLLAGFLQFLLLALTLKKRGILPRFANPLENKTITLTLFTFILAALSSSVVHINGIINHILATTLESGAVSYLYYAERIHQLPVAIIGLALGSALLPKLRKQEKFSPDMETSTYQALDITLVVILPASFGIAVTAPDIILTVYQRGAFDITDAYLTSNTLLALAFGLPAIVLIRITSTLFFSQQNTKIVFVIACITAFVNLSLALLFIPFFSFIGLALAASISAWINLFLSLLALHYYRYWHISRTLLLKSCLYTICAGLMAWTLYVLSSVFLNFEQIVLLSTPFRVGILFVKICFGIAFYSILLLGVSCFLPSDYKPIFLSHKR